MKKQTLYTPTIILLAACIVIGIFARWWKLGQVPVSLYWDEAAMLVDAKSVAQSGQDMHGNNWLQAIYPSYGDYKLPVYIWLAALSVKLFGVSAWSLRLPSATVGTLEILALAIFSVQLFSRDKVVTMRQRFYTLMNYFSRWHLSKSKHTKLLFFTSAAIFALIPWSIQFSRTGFEGHLGQFLLLLSIGSLFASSRPNKRKLSFHVLACVLGALAVYAYYSVRFVWPVLFLSYLFIFEFTPAWVRTRKIFNLDLLRIGLAAILGLTFWFLLLLPLYASPHYQASQTFRLSTDSILKNEDEILQSNVYRQMAGNGPASRILYHRYVLTGQELLKNYSAHLSLNYLFVSGDPNLRHGTGTTGLFQIWMLPLFFLGIFMLARKDRGVLLFLIIWWLIALLPASVPTTVPHALRSLNALVPTSVLISYGAYQLLLWLFSLKQKPQSIFIPLGFLIIIITSLFYLHDYFAHYPARSAFDWQDGYRQLSELIQKEHSPVRTVWVNPDDDRLYLWLMIYGDYSAQDFHSWESEGYQFPKIDNVVFEPFDWGKLETLDHKLIVVEKPGQLQGEPYRTEHITDESGKVRFDVGWYGR